MKKVTFIFGLIALFLVQDLLAQPTGRRTDAITMSAADLNTLATAMLGYIDKSVIDEHACNNEFGANGSGSIHGPEIFLNWHRDYLFDMEEAIAPTLATLGLNGVLPRWKHTDGFGPEPPGMERMLPMLQVDADCSISCGGGSCASPPGTGGPTYPYTNPLPCNNWAAFTTFSENLRISYHNPGHGALGGVMGNFRSPSSPIFWLWHAMIDDVYWDYQDQCKPTGELYIQDTPADMAIEPNPNSGPMWTSQDIWVRNDQDTPTGGTLLDHGSYNYANEGSHQNPEYKMNGDNYVYVRVRNNSATDVFSGGKLHVYWSKASTGLNWSTTWINYVIGGVLHGDEMLPTTSGGVPILTNMLLPPIQPGGQYIVEIPWEVPNPADFTNDIHHFCLLARMVSAWDEMTFPEVTSINTNVRNNNNIAWKNVSVYDIDPNNIIDPGGKLDEIEKLVEFQGVYVTNPYGTAYEADLEFQALDNEDGQNIFDIATYPFARMDKDLYTVWRNGGLKGNDFKALGWLGDRYYVVFTSQKGALYGLKLPPKSNMAMEMGFANARPAKYGQKFDLDVVQRKGKEVIGGERYEINIVKPGSANNNSTNNNATSGLVAGNIEIAPNPASDQFQVSYRVKGTQNVSMKLYDLSGKLINQSVEQTLESGLYREEFNVANLSSGIYFLQVTLGSNVINKKVVIE